MDESKKRTTKAGIAIALVMALTLALVPQPGSAQLVAVTWYAEDFEASDGGWQAFGTNSNPDYGHWSWGAPAAPPNTLPNMANVWGVDLDGPPPAGTGSSDACTFVKSPPILLPPAQDPLGIVNFAQIELSFQIWFNTAQAWEAAALSVSIDGGATWQWVEASGYNPWFWVNNPAHACLGLAGSPQFHTGIAWTGQYGPGSNTWTENTVDLTPFQGEEILLRFGYASDHHYPFTRGVFFDDVRIDLHLL